VFTVLCEVSEMCFGTVDCDDAHCYFEHIESFEKNSESMTDHLKQQLCVVKILLVSVKSTLYEIDSDEAKIKESLLQVKNCSKSCLENKKV